MSKPLGMAVKRKNHFNPRPQPLMALRTPTLLFVFWLVLISGEEMDWARNSKLVPALVFLVLFGPEFLPLWSIRLLRKLSCLPVKVFKRILSNCLTLFFWPFYSYDVIQMHAGENIKALMDP